VVIEHTGSNGTIQRSWTASYASLYTPIRYDNIMDGSSSGGSINGDRFDDIVAVYTSGELMWYRNSGSNTFSAPMSLGNAPGFRLMSV
jgi:hypothetical protein